MVREVLYAVRVVEFVQLNAPVIIDEGIVGLAEGEHLIVV